MSNKKSFEILERLKKITQVKTDSGLSEVLGVSPQTLSSWKGRDSIPYSICIELAQARGVSLDWLFGGQGPMLLQASLPVFDAQEQKMLMMFRVLDESNRNVVYNIVEEKKRLQELTHCVEELSARLESLIKLV